MWESHVPAVHRHLIIDAEAYVESATEMTKSWALTRGSSVLVNKSLSVRGWLGGGLFQNSSKRRRTRKNGAPSRWRFTGVSHLNTSYLALRHLEHIPHDTPQNMKRGTS